MIPYNDPDYKEKNGVCNYCWQFQRQEQIRKREAQDIPWVYEQIKKTGKSNAYDCLLGLSGGVDSSLCLHYLVENGIRPLCFSVDNGWNTPESDENIMRLVEGLKVPFFRFTIDLKVFRELQTAFIKSQTANIEIPTDHILMAASYQMALENNIKYIISGGNHATEGIMPKCYGYQARDLKFIKSIYHQYLGLNLEGLPMISLAQYLVNRFIKKIKVINLLDFYDYNRVLAILLLKEKYQWKDYGEKHCESRFTKWFQNFYLPFYFGFDKRRPHYSALINSGQMTREEALKKIGEPLEFDEIIKLEGDFNAKSYKDYPNSERLWDLLSRIYATFK